MTTKYFAHVCNKNVCKLTKPATEIKAVGYDSAFEKFVALNPSLDSDDLVHVFRYDTDLKQLINFGYHFRVGAWKKELL